MCLVVLCSNRGFSNDFLCIMYYPYLSGMTDDRETKSEKSGQILHVLVLTFGRTHSRISPSFLVHFIWDSGVTILVSCGFVDAMATYFSVSNGPDSDNPG